jgi:hypothetical protein
MGCRCAKHVVALLLPFAFRVATAATVMPYAADLRQGRGMVKQRIPHLPRLSSNGFFLCLSAFASLELQGFFLCLEPKWNMLHVQSRSPSQGIKLNFCS